MVLILLGLTQSMLYNSRITHGVLTMINGVAKTPYYSNTVVHPNRSNLQDQNVKISTSTSAILQNPQENSSSRLKTKTRSKTKKQQVNVQG